MKNTKKILTLSILSLLLFSCWEEDSKSELKIESIWNESINKIEFQEFKEELKYDKKENKLSIGDSVVIKEWWENIPKEIKIYKDSKTYINSNMTNYTFFIADEKEEVNIIGEYYISLFKWLWYTRILEEEIINEKEQKLNNLEIALKNKNWIEEEELEEDLSRLEFILKNEKYKLDEEGFSIDWEKEFNQRILINIHENTPKNIKNGMWLEWKYVEVYYNQN